MTSLAARVEALLFAAGEPCGASRLAQVCRVSEAEVEDALRELAAHLESGGHGVELCAVAGGYQLLTRPEHAAEVAELLQRHRPSLSHAALETLAVIAFRQPITRAGIDELRGVSSDSPLATLLERGLVREAGRADAPGHPLLYATTRRFLEHFGLRDISELKTVDLLREAPPSDNGDNHPPRPAARRS